MKFYTLFIISCVFLMYACNNEPKEEQLNDENANEEIVQSLAGEKKTNAAKKIVIPERVEHQLTRVEPKEKQPEAKPKEEIVIALKLDKLVEQAAKKNNYEILHCNQWSGAYSSNCKNKETFVTINQSNWKGLDKKGKEQNLKIRTKNIKEVVLRKKTNDAMKSDLKVRIFEFQNSQAAYSDFSNLLAISRYIFSDKSQIKHPNSTWIYKNYIFMFETRASAFFADAGAFSKSFSKIVKQQYN